MATISETRSPTRFGDWFWSYLPLFTSHGTIMCCALPLALVMLGLGASWAALMADAPWLVALSRHKNLVFAIAGALIFGNLIYIYLLAPRLKESGAKRARLTSACDTASRISWLALWASAAISLTGFSVAYLLPLAMGI